MKKIIFKKIELHLAYKEMQKNILEKIKEGDYEIGFCFLLPYSYLDFITSCGKDGKYWALNKVEWMEKYFPELYTYKPEVNEDGNYWFDRTHHQRRLNILNDIVNSTYSKLNWFEKRYIEIFR